jgi:hypothetical protein
VSTWRTTGKRYDGKRSPPKAEASSRDESLTGAFRAHFERYMKRMAEDPKRLARESAELTMAENERAIFDRFIARTDGHIWRQVGMTGSDYDVCVLCLATSEGLGREADEKALKPCAFEIDWRNHCDPPYIRVGRAIPRKKGTP